MSAQRVVWLILPVVLTAMSLWLIAFRTPASRVPLGIIVVLCIVGCVRQAFLFRGKGQKAYAFVTFAGAIIALVALLVSSLRFN
jgi:heme/copper-type cytochrome/quinol oxidase subunit 4